MLFDDPELIKRENKNRGLIEQRQMTCARTTWKALHILYTQYALAWKRYLIKKKRYKQHHIDLVNLLEDATKLKIRGHKELKSFIGDPKVYVQRSIRKQSLAVAVCYYLKWYLPKGMDKSFSCFQNIHPKNISNARNIFKDFQPDKKEAHDDWVEVGNDFHAILKLEQIKSVQKFVDETYPQRVEVTEEETQDFLDSFNKLLQLYRFQRSQRRGIKRNIKRTAADVSGSTQDNDDGVDDCARYSSKLCFDVPDKSFHLAQIHELLDIVQNLPKIKEYQRALVKINIAQTILADLTQTIQVECDPKGEKSDGPTPAKWSRGRKDMDKDIENEKGKDCEDGRDEDDEYTADEIALSRRLKGAKYRARQANGQIVKLPPTADAVSEDKRDEGTCQASSRKSLYSTDKINLSDTSSYCLAMSELLKERQMNNHSTCAGEFVSQPSKTSEIAATPRTDRKRVWQGNGDKKSLNDPAAQVMDSSGSGCDSQILKMQSLKTAAAGDDSLTKKARGIQKKLRRLLL